MAVDLCELLQPECIELELPGRKKTQILRELVKVVSRSGDTGDPDALYEALVEREKLGSTGIGNGIAIPHCMTSRTTGTHIAFGRKREGARFDSVDNQPVTLFFLLVGPENDTTLHLQVLSKLARYLHDEAFRSSLLAAGSPEDVIGAFRNREST